MILSFLLLLTSIVCFFHLNYTENQSERMEFPDQLKSLCPYTRFCDLHGDLYKTDGHKANPEVATIPCCSPCSCSKDCGRKRNCCRDKFDIYKLDENFGTVCRRLQLQSGYPFYHIIDKCPDRSQTCQEQGATRNGKYHPVYSNTNGMIYFNKACSKCHGQSNITTLLPIITCKQLELSYFSIIKGIKSDEIVNFDNCAVNFLPPDGIDLSTELCYPNKVRRCSKTRTFSDETEHFCHSFNATFHTQRHTYNNVFCFLCNIDIEFSNQQWKRGYEFCPVVLRKNLIGNSHLSIILDNKYVEESYRVDPENAESKWPDWCWRAGNKTLCRHILCPEGQEYQDGVCHQVAKRWFFTRLRMIISLVPSDVNAPVEVPNGFLGPDYNDTFESLFALSRPGLEDWNVTLFHNIDTVNRSVRYFVAILTYKRNNILAKQFLKKVSKHLSLPWKLTQNELVTSLQPTYHRFLRYTGLNKTMFVPRWYNTEPSYTKSLNQNIDSYVLQFLTGDIEILKQQQKKETMFLTKVYFCNLVELIETEYEEGTITIYLVHNGRILGDGEFIWVRNEDGLYKLRVCAHDMGEGSLACSSAVRLCKIGMFVCIFVCLASRLISV